MKKLKDVLEGSVVEFGKKDKFSLLHHYISAANEYDNVDMPNTKETQKILNGHDHNYHIPMHDKNLFAQAEDVLKNHHKWNHIETYNEGLKFGEAKQKASDNDIVDSTAHAIKSTGHHEILGRAYERFGHLMYTGE